MGNKSKLLISLLTGTVLFCGYYFGVPAILNSQQSQNFIKQSIKKDFGLDIELNNSKFKTHITPTISFAADNFKILNSDKTNALYLENFSLKLNLLPLIIGKIEIKEFLAEDFFVNLVLDNELKLKLGDNNIPKTSKSNFTIQRASLGIKKYQVLFNDNYINKQVILNGSDFIITDFTNNKNIKISTTGAVLTGNKTAEIDTNISIKLPLNNISKNQININGKIKNLNLADFSTYAKVLSGNKIEKLSGIINLGVNTLPDKTGKNHLFGKLEATNFGLMQKDISASIYYPDTLTLTTDTSFDNNSISIHNLIAKSEGIDVNLSGKITELSARIPQVDLKLAINKSRIEKFLPLLPGEENFQDVFNLYLLKKHKYYGDILGNLNIKGNYLKPNITGSIFSSNGYLEKPIPNNTPKATIKLKFNGDKTYLDATVPASLSETVFVKGDIELYDEKKSDLIITSTNSVDLKTAQNILNPLHKILKFELGPVPIMDIQGKGNINLHVVGNQKDPHAWGVFNFKNTTASFLDIKNMVLHNGDGALTFDDQNSHFKTKHAELYGKPISIEGTCTLLGILDFNVQANNQNSSNLLNIVKTSPMLIDIQQIATPIQTANGLINIDLNLTGTVRNVYDIVFNKNIFAKGTAQLSNNEVQITGIPLTLKNLNGTIDFKNFDGEYDLATNIGDSKIRTNGKLLNSILQTTIYSDKFTLRDAATLALSKNKNIPFQNDLATISTSFIANYKGEIDKVNPNNLNIKGKIYPNNGSKSTIITNGGNFELKNSHFKISPIKGTFKKNPYILTADISNIFTPKQIVNAYFSMSRFNLANIANLRSLEIFPTSFSPEDIKDMKGILDITARIRRNNLSFFTKLDDTEFLYVPKNLKIKFNSGNLLVQNDVLTLGKLNAQVGEMPILIDGNIFNFYKNPDMNLYVNAKPTQEFFDQFFNNKAVYPIKVKGDIFATSKITGNKNKVATKTELKIAEDSYLYYMGATIGNTTNQVKLYLDNIITPKWAKVNHFKYDKIIPSQNNKNFANTQLISSGFVEFLPDNNLFFKDFKVKTENPTDAKIFNIIFRKPFMKQGIFTSDLVINGYSLTPKIIGTLDITSIDIPFVNSTINDVHFNFTPDKIFIETKGVVLTNKINLNAIIKNNLKPPYIIEDLNLKLKDLNINKFTDAIRDFESDLYRTKTATSSSDEIDLSQLIIKNANINADTIQVKNINAEDFSSTLSLNEKMQLDINDFQFKLAEGSVNGNMQYDFLTNNVNLLVHMKNSNAQIMAETLFNLQNQIYGSVTGDVELNCNATTQESCTKSLSGNGYFIVENGKMPKLGSLEYLLKAGNLIKGGITGLSINGIIDLITPLKTGEFDSISGNLNFADGVAQSINIYSNGKDLNMYLKGTYDFSSSIANMNVYGTLSNNMTNVFGKIKNVSLNTLFNTIPLMNKNELSPEIMAEINKIPNLDLQNIYRIFNAEINGDINGNDYVRTFKWIK